MGTPVRHIVDDVIIDLNQMSDDQKITEAQVAYWVIIVGNRLRAQHIQKRNSGAFLTTFAEIPVQVSDVTGDNLVRFRKFFDLPESIYDFNNDNAIHYISYSVEEELPNELPPLTNVKFSRTTPAALKSLYMNPYAKPDVKNPYFYRSGSRIYLMGIECIDVDSVEVGLFLSIPPVTEIDPDQELDFPEELILVLKKNVLEMGRFALLVPKERINDGTDSVNPAEVPTSKIVSVNDPINLSDTQ